MANIKQTVDFSQGTLNNLVVVNNKLQLSSVAAPSFTRNSIAYKSDGTLVNTNLPRYEQGKFAQAVMVEEGTTNIFTDSGFESGSTTSWNSYAYGGTGTWSVGSGYKRSGSYGARIDGGSNGFFIHQSLGTYGQVYSISFKVKREDGAVLTASHVKAVCDNKLFAFDSITAIGDGWYICKKANVTRTTYTPIWGIKAEAGVVVYVDECQMENKAYCTSYHDSTRSPETLTIPTAGVLNPQEGTIECWVYVPEFWKQGIPNWRRIWGIGRGAGAGMYVLRYDPDNGKIVFGIYNNAGTAQNISVAKPSVGWHYFAAKWSASEMALLIDGVKVGSITNPNLPSNFADTVISIGCRPDSPYDNVNTLIDDLRISSRARTDEEIAAAYQSGQPLRVDEWTTYLLRFSGALNFGRGGYYISPQYDLSTVGSYVKHRVYWQEDADQGECLVYAKLDNQSDWTQLTNGGSLPIVEGQDLTGRKIQFKVKLLDLV